MNYFDVFSSRINHLGTTTAERIRNGGIRSFYKWMAQSPHTVNNLSVERGIYFSGIILTNKDKEYQKIMYLNVANDVAIRIGDIINWTLDDGSIEKWIIIQEEKKVNGTYRTFWIVRCNYLVKWIDTNGHLQQSWAYLVSSVDDKIKGNYRTWNSLITPQPNKYLEILMPRFPIDRATNFIVENEGWDVIEYDHTSVPGVIYLSLTESKVNLIYDDLKNNIADLDKLAEYKFIFPEEKETFEINKIIVPTFTLMKNGKVVQLPVEFIPRDKRHINVVNGELRGIAEGDTNIVIQCKDYPEIRQEITIAIASERIFSAYIEGADKIKLDYGESCWNNIYTLKGISENENKVTFSISDKKLANIIPNNEIHLDNFDPNTQCVIRANDKNLLGSFILTAIYSGQQYTKEIQVIPLW